MNKKLHKEILRIDIRDIKEYLEDLKREYRAHLRESKKTITKIQRELKRLNQKQDLLKSL